jgi:hypothetical protein
MEDKYNEYAKELIRTLKQIEILIEDNNQNIKDCISILKDINKIVLPKPKSNILTFLFNVFGGRK